LIPKNNFDPGSFRFINTLFKKPYPHQVKGDIRLGYVQGTPFIFGIKKKEAVQHLLITGRSGSGKTNVIRIIQIELNRLKIPFISFDLAKYGTRYIKHIINDLIILRLNKEFFFAILKPPPGVNPIEWLMAFCEITAEVFGFGTASKLFFIKFVIDLYKKFDAERSGILPTMHDINKGLEKRRKEKIPSNEKGYINTIRYKIDPICMTLGDAINVQKGISIEELLKHPVCIELVEIKSSEIQIWIMSLIMAWITCYRESQKMPFGRLRHVFFFDECAKVLGKGDS